MTSREAFEAAIAKAEPDDETIRLVFADWLDENGEHEEAERQRKYVPALRYLADLIQPCGNCEGYGDIGPHNSGHSTSSPCPDCGGTWNSGPFLHDDEPYTRGTGKSAIRDWPRVMEQIAYWFDSVSRHGSFGMPPYMNLLRERGEFDSDALKQFAEAFHTVAGVPPVPDPWASGFTDDDIDAYACRNC